MALQAFSFAASRFVLAAVGHIQRLSVIPGKRML
jgi:hypothetical protein